MSAVTSVSVNPNDAEGYVNKINIIDATGPNGEKLDVPCYYVPFGVNNATFGFNDFVSSDLIPGINYPDRYAVGKKYIDIVLTGDDDFEKKQPEIYQLSSLKIEPKIFASFTLFTAEVLYGYAFRIKKEEMQIIMEKRKSKSKARAYSRCSKLCAKLSAGAVRASNKLLSLSWAANLPSKRLLIKPAARLAMLINFPTKSEFTRATKSLNDKSMSSILLLSLAPM